ncbi:hypothetical protein [Maricaulis sp. CAU 1757]
MTGDWQLALSDALIILAVGAGLVRIWPWRRRGPARFVRLGLILIGLAALVGALRYGLGGDGVLPDLHTMTSRLAASAGLLLIATGGLFAVDPDRVPPALSRYVRVAIPVVLVLVVIWPGTSGLIGLVSALAVLIGLGTAGLLLVRQRRVSGAAWGAAWLVILATSWTTGHVSHALIALFAVLAAEALRRTLPRP